MKTKQNKTKQNKTKTPITIVSPCSYSARELYMDSTRPKNATHK
jgi:hypothetical protein